MNISIALEAHLLKVFLFGKVGIVFGVRTLDQGLYRRIRLLQRLGHASLNSRHCGIRGILLCMSWMK